MVTIFSSFNSKLWELFLLCTTNLCCIFCSIDPRRDLPTVVKPKDPETAESVASSRDKALVRGAARSVVSVFSTALDGKVIERCTGIFVGWKETKKCARVSTGYDIVRGFHPKK
nr:unnamed protein product [Digitaria exilis]